MKNIYIVLILLALLSVSIICKQQENFISNNLAIVKTSNNQFNDPNIDLTNWGCGKGWISKPFTIPAAKNVTNDRKDDAYITYDYSYVVNPKYRFHPENKHQITFLLNKKKFGTDIRVSGSNSTFNDISITKDTIIRTDRFNKVLKLDQTRKQVTVESGVLLKDLNDHLAEVGLTVPVYTDLNHSVGGAVSLGVHGCCATMGSIASYVVDITMVLADGKIKTYTKKDKEFKALTTGLGCLGFIYSVTLQCIDNFVVRHEEILANWEDVYPNLKNYLDSNNLLQVYLLDVHNPKLPCVLFLRKKVKSMNVMDYLPNTNRNLKIGYAHEILGNDVSGDYTVQELGISLKHLDNAIKDIVALAKGYKYEFDLDSQFPVIIKFSGKDKKSYLSGSKCNVNCWISLYNDIKDLNKDCLDKMTKEVEDKLIVQYKARPSYETRNNLNEEKMSWLYGHDYRDFQYIRDRMDHERLFTNDYVKRVIGK